MSATVLEKLRKRYQCSTCSRSWSSRKRCEEHTARCAADPAAKACKTCEHDNWPGGEGEYAGCDLGLRDEATTIVFGCQSWAPKRRLA